MAIDTADAAASTTDRGSGSRGWGRNGAPREEERKRGGAEEVAHLGAAKDTGQAAGWLAQSSAAQVLGGMAGARGEGNDPGDGLAERTTTTAMRRPVSWEEQRASGTYDNSDDQQKGRTGRAAWCSPAAGKNDDADGS
ncbi:hypothetical protein E2562_036194 [Oryza meyeriana var. granulata]|uniref:DUF834 domain-containing protein n=1 Tax=Oryza meyeriana var. granulata TaxID=110450 RepID=A0A6G1ET26_9ORYZ|nr:hypothetical protein E2562_036194 [Oryza meyeriana var. granulata]